MRGEEDCCCRAAYGLIVNGNFIRPSAKDGSANDMCAAINFKQLQQTQAQDKGAGWGTNVLASFFGGMYGNAIVLPVVFTLVVAMLESSEGHPGLAGTPLPVQMLT